MNDLEIKVADVKIVKTERDCPWNKEAPGRGRKKVYDYQVHIDGQYRAYFTQVTGRTIDWELRDVNHGPIKWRKESSRAIHCRGQKRFLAILTEYLHAIPTMEQYAERAVRAAEERQRIAAEAKAEQEAEARRQRLEGAQDELLAAAKYAVEAMCNMRQGRFQGATARLQRVIDQIEGKDECKR